jgi:hypothetical protein
MRHRACPCVYLKTLRFGDRRFLLMTQAAMRRGWMTSN